MILISSYVITGSVGPWIPFVIIGYRIRILGISRYGINAGGGWLEVIAGVQRVCGKNVVGAGRTAVVVLVVWI